METTYYTITAREILVSGDGVRQAAGGARQLVCRRCGGRTPARDNIIDLAAWKAAREEPDPEPERAVTACGRRPRRDRREQVLLGGELLATVCVIGVMLLLAARILVG